MTKLHSSDGFLFLILITTRENPSLKDIISIGDSLYHDMLSLSEINQGLSRLNAIGLIEIESKSIVVTDEGKSFFSQNKKENEGCIVMQLRYRKIFSTKIIPCKVKYVNYFSETEYYEACKKNQAEGMALINSIIKGEK